MLSYRMSDKLQHFICSNAYPQLDLINVGLTVDKTTQVDDVTQSLNINSLN